MKKMLLVLVFGLVTSVASAALVNWRVGPNLIAKDGTTLKGVVAYLVQGTPTSTTLDALKAGTWDGTEAVKSATTNPIGGIGVSNIENTSWTAGGTYSFYMIAFDAATIADAENFMVSNVLSTTAGDGNTITTGTLQWIADNTEADIDGTMGWTQITTTIPEPTVLALLALGVAGLALRRRA